MSARELRTFADLRALRSKLASLPGVGNRIASRVADTFTRSARSNLASGRSVYGKPFESRKTGKALTLRKSGRMLDVAASFVAIGRIIRSTIAAVPYARYYVRDGILPRSALLPQSWEKDATTIAREEIERALAVGAT